MGILGHGHSLRLKLIGFREMVTDVLHLARIPMNVRVRESEVTCNDA